MEEAKLIEKINSKFADEKFKIIYCGKNSKDNTILQCLDCNRKIIVPTGELLRTRRKHICSKCAYKRQDTIRNENLIREKLSNTNCTNIEFYMQEIKGIRVHMVHYNCGRCGRINNKRVSNLLRQKYNCSYCEGAKEAKDTDVFQQQLSEKFGGSFTLLNEYVDAKTSVRIRCNNCGFIRDVKPGALLISGYCPKCSSKSSKGEQIIISYLINHNIDFETQRYFKDWNIGIHYFDFYIPKYNLVLEYHGRQHTEYIEYFHHNIENFKYRQNKDTLKQQTALSRGLNYCSISFKCFNNLTSILDYIFNSTTIPEGSRGKCLEIETIQNIG